MREKKIRIVKCIFILFVLLLNAVVFLFVGYNQLDTAPMTLQLDVETDHADTWQLYYASGKQDFSEEHSVSVNVGKTAAEKSEKVSFALPLQTERLRLDPGTREREKFRIRTAAFVSHGRRLEIPVSDIGSAGADGISGEGEGKYVTRSGDPYIMIPLREGALTSFYRKTVHTRKLILDFAVCVILDVIALFAVLRFEKLIDIPIKIYQNRRLVASLAKNDFKTKYAGSYLGIIWAFIQPIVTILVYWFVFSVGFRAGRMSDYPYVLYIVVGLVPWFFFSDALNGGTNALREYQYLVKKVMFQIDILPVVKVGSALFVHFFFILFAMILCACYGYFPGFAAIQILYYVLCNAVLVTGLVYFTSAVVVFFQDLGQFINVFVLQVGIWVTPIMWVADQMLSPLWLRIFRLNPVYYIVSGFRDSLLARQWFWQGDRLLWTIYFWCLCFLIYGFGVRIYKRLREHFADIL